MTKLLKQLVVDPDFGTIRLPGPFGHGKIKSVELIGEPTLIKKPGQMDEGVAISERALPEANAYMVGSVSDPRRKRGTEEWFRDYWVQFYKVSE